jgi:hypothetical protein
VTAPAAVAFLLAVVAAPEDFRDLHTSPSSFLGIFLPRNFSSQGTCKGGL